MTASGTCSQCGSDYAEHDSYGRCPERQPRAVAYAVGVVISYMTASRGTGA